MMADDEQIPATDARTLPDISGNYQPIHLEDTVGAVFLGIFAVMSLIGWMRAEARYRALITQAGTSEAQGT